MQDARSLMQSVKRSAGKLRTVACCVIGLTFLAACTSNAPLPTAPPETSATSTAVAFPTALPTATPQPTPTIAPTQAPKLHQLTTGGCCVMPSWSPDSKQILFIDKPAAQAEAGVYAVDIDHPQEPKLIGPVGIYSQDRSLVAYPVDVRTVVERLSTGDRWVIPNNGQALEFSPDNRRVAWEIEAISGPYDERQTDIFMANYDGSDAVKVTRVYGGGLVGWLPRGVNMLFLGRPSLNTPERTLTALDLRTNVATDLVTAERISGVSTSRDGSWVAYFISFNADEKRNGIWVQRTDGSDARQLDVWGAYQWRDDSHLLIIPARPSADQPFEVWQVNAETGEKQKLTDAAVTPLDILNGDWRVSPDGKRVVFVNGADRNLWLLELPDK
jgi:Tol biopolymer transport system component